MGPYAAGKKLVLMRNKQSHCSGLKRQAITNNDENMLNNYSHMYLSPRLACNHKKYFNVGMTREIQKYSLYNHIICI